MLHLGDTFKREAKYSYLIVYTDTCAAIKQTRAVDHNSGPTHVNGWAGYFQFLTT